MSTQVKSATVRLKTLSGLWETVGVDRMAGIVPELGDLLADEWGSATGGFSLRRDPGVTWPDLGAYGDVEIEIGSRVVWDGRISQTPVADGDDPVVNVQCEGWRKHLEDDVYRRNYVHTTLADYKDMRAYRNVDLGLLRQAGTASTDKGVITFGWPNGTTLPANAAVGVMLTLGPGSEHVKRVVVDWQSSANMTNNWTLVVRGADTLNAVIVGGSFLYSDVFTVNNPGAGAIQAGTCGTSRANLAIFLYSSLATNTTDDVWVRINAVQIFSNTAYESGNVSVLKAPTIINNALDRATLLLSADRSGIDPGNTVTFAFPEFKMDAQRTPREVIDAANAPLGYRAKVAIGRRMVFEPKPTVAALEIGEWPGAVFEDASANSGDEIYSGVVVEGTQADGNSITVLRTAAGQSGVTVTPVASPTPDNPSFASNTTSWTPSSGTTLTRDTGVFDTSPASGRWDRGASNLNGSDILEETFTGTFLAGVMYMLTVRLRGTVSGAEVVAHIGTASGGDEYFDVVVLTTSFQTVQLAWTPQYTHTSGAKFWLDVNDATKIYVDSLSLSSAQPTLVDRRGFKRTKILPVRNSLTPELGQQIGDAWLREHKTTPLKGTVRVSGDGAVRDILTGRSIAPEELLTRTGDLLRLSHRVDPDTGGWGRDGRIAQVSYSAAEDVAVVTLDSTRMNVEGLLEQLAIVVGSS